jgi:hypothetical protein
MEQKKIDWYLRFIFLFIFLAGIFFAINYYITVAHECTSRPLQYYIDNIKETTDEELYISGQIIIMGNITKLVVPFGDGVNVSG